LSSKALVRQPGGFESRGLIDIPLADYHAPVAHRKDNRRIGLHFDAAAFAAPVFVQQHDDEVVDVKELLWLEPTLFPRFEVRCLKRAEYLGSISSAARFQSCRMDASMAFRTISTFSSDIAQAVSRDLVKEPPS
jgi:hypothetical protein